MRSNPERLAWTVLWLCLAVFCGLAVGTPLGIRSFLLNSTQQQEPLIQAIEGTILVQKANGGEPIGVTESAELSVGDVIITDASSWASLDLFDRSHAILYSNTRVELLYARRPRFRLSKRPNEIGLSLSGGLLRVGVAMPGERDTEFQVGTPHSLVYLDEGSYRIEVTNEGTLVTVVRGRATVGRDALRTSIPSGTRIWVGLDGRPEEPLPAARNLIVNGNFQEPLSSGWMTDTVELAPHVRPPTVEVIDTGGRRALHLVRREGDSGNHTQAIAKQTLDQNVRDFARLEVSLDVRLDFQSLSGGGLQSSEFPVIVRLDYRDRWGTDKFWTHGFYFQNPAEYTIALDPWGRPTGEQIPPGVWYPYQSGNLLDLLGDAQPAHLTGLTVYASGWNYDSLVSEIQLIVE